MVLAVCVFLITYQWIQVHLIGFHSQVLFLKQLKHNLKKKVENQIELSIHIDMDLHQNKTLESLGSEIGCLASCCRARGGPGSNPRSSSGGGEGGRGMKGFPISCALCFLGK